MKKTKILGFRRKSKPKSTKIKYHILDNKDETKIRAFIVMSQHLITGYELKNNDGLLLLPQLCGAFYNEFKKTPYLRNWRCRINITPEVIRNTPILITRLNMRRCFITIKVIKALPKTLTSLNLRGCKNLTDNGVKLLPQTLTSLNLTNCYKVSDEGVKSFNTKSMVLKELHLANCSNVTLDRIIIPKTIRYMELHGCNVTIETLYALSAYLGLSALYNGKKLEY